MLALRIISPLTSDVSQPLIILAAAIGFAGLAILVLVLKGRI